MKKDAKILVTGGNGHVGYNLVQMLLDDGYVNLRVSVRDKDNPQKTMALKALGVSDIVSLDIRDAARFEEVCRGIDYLFHVAATYRFHTDSATADAEMIKDSLEGVRSAMSAAAKCGVRKVILTSSIVTLPLAKNGESIPDETRWVENPQIPYLKAKSEAERLAWSMADNLGINLVSLLPGAVLGPGFGRGTQSTDYVLAITKGSMRMGTIAAKFPVIDVRDIVRGHILAAEKDAKGRYILATDNAPSFVEVIKIMRKIDPKVPGALMIIPRLFYGALPAFDWLTSRILDAPRTATRAMVSPMRSGDMLADNSKSKRDLGWSQQYTLEQTLRDTMRELKAA